MLEGRLFNLQSVILNSFENERLLREYVTFESQICKISHRTKYIL